MEYKGRKVINQERKSAHWLSLLCTAARSRASIFLWASTSQSKKGNAPSYNSNCQKAPVIQQKQSFSWAETCDKFLSWLLLKGTGWCGRRYSSQHPITDLRTFHTMPGGAGDEAGCPKDTPLSCFSYSNQEKTCPQPALHSCHFLTLLLERTGQPKRSVQK